MTLAKLQKGNQKASTQKQTLYLLERPDSTYIEFNCVLFLGSPYVTDLKITYFYLTEDIPELNKQPCLLVKAKSKKKNIYINIFRNVLIITSMIIRVMVLLLLFFIKNIFFLQNLSKVIALQRHKIFLSIFSISCTSIISKKTTCMKVC